MLTGICQDCSRETAILVQMDCVARGNEVLGCDNVVHLCEACAEFYNSVLNCLPFCGSDFDHA